MLVLSCAVADVLLDLVVVCAVQRLNQCKEQVSGWWRRGQFVEGERLGVVAEQKRFKG